MALRGKRKRLLIAATGASGAPLLMECLRMVAARPDWESCLIMSRGARLTLGYETDFTVEEVFGMADSVLEPEAIDAAPASGSYAVAGMLIVPCSMKTVAGIAGGYADNLILRAADVTIKEQRPLVLAVRESPLSAIHLHNMYELSRLPGVRLVPPMLTYYHRPLSVQDMTYHCACRLLQPFGLEDDGMFRWGEDQRMCEDSFIRSVPGACAAS